MKVNASQFVAIEEAVNHLVLSLLTDEVLQTSGNNLVL